jgi:hypothetical protein
MKDKWKFHVAPPLLFTFTRVAYFSKLYYQNPTLNVTSTSWVFVSDMLLLLLKKEKWKLWGCCDLQWIKSYTKFHAISQLDEPLKQGHTCIKHGDLVRLFESLNKAKYTNTATGKTAFSFHAFEANALSQSLARNFWDIPNPHNYLCKVSVHSLHTEFKPCSTQC